MCSSVSHSSATLPDVDLTWPKSAQKARASKILSAQLPSSPSRPGQTSGFGPGPSLGFRIGGRDIPSAGSCKAI
ncbi:hypothetical protein BV25DRAFT_1378930 [Artomyces pyxidatus]|uniref:Uncharacterized protein n=1 Tax=Artomyces pyxidatus TaxID=48021 RepID=A0ACB8TCP3_9AGAM|nr:hypothetical protein BV25DRAFT_1378930 [Artomyces pyxidatus]